MAVRDDLLPTQDVPSNGARIQVTDQLTGTPVTVNGPTIEVVAADGKLTIGGGELGDTGDVDVSSNVLSNWVVNRATMRRCDNDVEMVLELEGGAGGSAQGAVLTIPSGFIPRFNRFGCVNIDPFPAGASVSTQVADFGQFLYFGPTVDEGVTVRFYGRWMARTDAAWPTI